MNDDSRTPVARSPGWRPRRLPDPCGRGARPDLWDLVDTYIDLVRNRPDLVSIFDKRFPPSVVAQDAQTRMEAERWLRTHLGV